MIKKILPLLLLVALCVAALFSCKKSSKSNVDASVNYFPLQYGKYVTYAVDSIYYIDSSCERIEIKSQMKYSITDTTTYLNKPSYIMDVFSRPYDGSDWKQISVIIVTPTTEGLLFFQDQNKYLKMVFPVANDVTWAGNKYVQIQDTTKSYLRNWIYKYQNYHLSFNNGLVNFDNTVTVSENNLDINYPTVDSAVNASSTYAKEVYAYGVGMIYKEWTHTTYKADTSKCLQGYRVVMRAIEYN
jgi:hypothetical protein